MWKPAALFVWQSSHAVRPIFLRPIRHLTRMHLVPLSKYRWATPKLRFWHKKNVFRAFFFIWWKAPSSFSSSRGGLHIWLLFLPHNYSAKNTILDDFSPSLCNPLNFNNNNKLPYWPMMHGHRHSAKSNENAVSLFELWPFCRIAPDLKERIC